MSEELNKEMSQEELLFQRYYNEVPGVAVSIINTKLGEAIQEINKQTGKELDLLDLYRCTSFAMIGAIEALSKDYKITDEIRQEIVGELSEFLDKFTAKDRAMKELYIAPHILVDMISYMVYQRIEQGDE